MFSNLKLKRSEKRAIKWGVFVVLGVIFLNVVVFPLTDSYRDLGKEKATLTDGMKNIMAKLKEGQGLDQEIAKYTKELTLYKDKSLEGESVELSQVALEELVNKLAKAQGLSVTNTYKERAKDVEFGYREVTTRITVKGDFDAIIHFLEAIQQAPELIAATEISLKHYRGYDATVTVTGLAKKEKS